MKSERYRMNCPICQNNLKPLLQFKFDYLLLKKFEYYHEIKYCRSCQFGITSPILDQEALLDYYKINYIKSLKNNFLLNLIQKVIYFNDLIKIKKIIKDTGLRLLDLGAGNGKFVFFMRKNGYLAEGIEFDSDAIKNANTMYEVELKKENFDSLNFNSKFNIIIMRHTLEHSSYPILLLENLFENAILPNGLLVLKVPNFNSIEAKLFKQYWHGYDIPRHRFHFSKKSITKILQNLNYKCVIVKSETIPLDFYRSIQNFCSQKNNTLNSILGISVIKTLLLLVLSPLIFFLGIFGSSRIVVYAQK